ncbi:hypothetical protein MUDAN_MDHGFNIF_02667 [Lactiplantibacillus mudanjiangensis]|uniref:Uncharacterized protein n=1 Tax=Lactiplantibacillus mudanjiangensis TaxID=1296538 RepID=A0A660DXH8_9LACO|nr:hypothetical protein MUDAN_IGPPGNFN_02238 [Lactiplantibacillus mudanjiangensis]VDG27844.1 hypothetical protein MUDAN_MDHGFNIF_02667 [Lactiplantibacillus mudanjiangensis]
MIIVPSDICIGVVTWLVATCWFKRHEINHKLFDEGSD